MDFIAITGDVVESGDIPSYLKVREFLDMFKVPFFLVPGNHDRRETFREAFSPSYHVPKSGPLDFNIDLDGAQIIGLDTLVEGQHTGRLTTEQLVWLGEKLSANRHPHTVVLMHQAPFLTGVGFFDRLNKIEGHEQFADLIASAQSDITVLCGHTHRPYQALWKGANCYVSGALASQYGGKDPFGDGKVGAIEEPFAYFIHTLGGPGDHVVTTRYLNLDSPASKYINP